MKILCLIELELVKKLQLSKVMWMVNPVDLTDIFPI